MTRTPPTARPRLLKTAILAAFLFMLVLRLSGAFTVGVVATDSMEPTLPVGALFLALPSDPSVDDVVVFTAPTGDRVVHRVVAIEDGRLITKGDANMVTDQQAGWPPVDPEKTQKIPQPGGLLTAFETPIQGALLILLTQGVLLTGAVLGATCAIKQRSPLRRLTDRPALAHPHALRRRLMRPHRVLLMAAAALLVFAPLFGQEYNGDDEVLVSSSLLPVVVHVTTDEGSGTWTLTPFSEQETGLTGPASVTIAPAVPGAVHLAPYGSMAAFVPLVALVCLVALLFRMSGG